MFNLNSWQHSSNIQILDAFKQFLTETIWQMLLHFTALFPTFKIALFNHLSPVFGTSRESAGTNWFSRTVVLRHLKGIGTSRAQPHQQLFSYLAIITCLSWLHVFDTCSYNEALVLNSSKTCSIFFYSHIKLENERS